MSENGFFASKVIKTKHLFRWGSMLKVGTGKHYKFWDDFWMHNVPVKLLYDDLYKMAREPSCFVADYWEDGTWVVDFVRCFYIQEYGWLGLLENLNDMPLQTL